MNNAGVCVQDSKRSDYTFVMNGSWIGGRDLSKYYQYSNHYSVSDGLFGVSDQKWQRVSDYWQWDLSISKEIKSFEVTLGVQNIFDYTQTGEGDSPAMWHLQDRWPTHIWTIVMCGAPTEDVRLI